MSNNPPFKLTPFLYPMIKTKRRTYSKVKKAGYVFPMALAVVSIITLMIALASDYIRSTHHLAITLDAHIHTRMKLISAENKVIYTIMSEPLANYGIAVGSQGIWAEYGELELNTADEDRILADGRGYKLISSKDSEPTYVHLFDANGMISINQNSLDMIEEIGVTFGSEPLWGERLYALISDYIDDNERKRFGGAESEDYPDQTKPVNAPLRSAEEICVIPFWRDLPICLEPEILAVTTTTAVNKPLNLFAASRTALQLILDDKAMAEAVVNSKPTLADRRFNNPKLNIWTRSNDSFALPLFPGPDFVIISHGENESFMQKTRYRFTPGRSDMPVFLHNRSNIGATARKVLMDEIRKEQFPVFTATEP